MSFVSAAVYDPETGKQVALNYYDSSDLVVYVGSKHIEPLGTLVVPADGELHARGPQQGRQPVGQRPDRRTTAGTSSTTSVLVKIE